MEEMNMEMNQNNRVEKLEIVEMPAAVATQVFVDVHRLAEMHRSLIQMYALESALKKQHKAYLHVREQAEAMCALDSFLVDEILDHYANPKAHLSEALQLHNSLSREEQQEIYRRTRDCKTNREWVCSGSVFRQDFSR
jgi:hypothetical protein